ncbi:MAG: hypothetical protein ACJ78M_10340, partial [Gemmatimonadaceae bacterium]
ACALCQTLSFLKSDMPHDRDALPALAHLFSSPWRIFFLRLGASFFFRQKLLASSRLAAASRSAHGH